MKGDVDLDGKVSGSDAVELHKYLMTVSTLTPEQGARADMDGNGRLNAADLTLLKRIIK